MIMKNLDDSQVTDSCFVWHYFQLTEGLCRLFFLAVYLAVIVDIQKKRTGLLLRIITAAVLKSF